MIHLMSDGTEIRSIAAGGTPVRVTAIRRSSMPSSTHVLMTDGARTKVAVSGIPQELQGDRTIFTGYAELVFQDGNGGETRVSMSDLQLKALAEQIAAFFGGQDEESPATGPRIR